jgi:hypothetical protein
VAVTRRRLATIVVLVATSIAVSCGADDVGVGSPVTELLVRDAAQPVALLAEADGGLLYAERKTGRVRRVLADGSLVPEPVATVATSGADTDQRGLLGLARDGRGRLFAAWTEPDDGRILVGELQSAPHEPQLPEPRLVWLGPVSALLANGGHLAMSPSGELVVGIGGLLGDPTLANDPTVVNGKMLALDPDGPADQQPRVLSGGWNNPFGFVFAPDGALWLADNTGAEGPERLGRGDQPSTEALGLSGPGPGSMAPSALVAFDERRLGLCGFLSDRMQLVEIVDGRPTPPGEAVTDHCTTGATILTDGRIVVATMTELRVRPPLPPADPRSVVEVEEVQQR